MASVHPTAIPGATVPPPGRAIEVLAVWAEGVPPAAPAAREAQMDRAAATGRPAQGAPEVAAMPTVVEVAAPVTLAGAAVVAAPFPATAEAAAEARASALPGACLLPRRAVQR